MSCVPLSWCKHRSAEAEEEPQPADQYRLSRHVAEALLPVYQRLSDPQLLARCQGGKTQNATESLHSVIWSLLSKDEHASLFTVETAVHEAVSRDNPGNLHAYDMQECARPWGSSLVRKPSKGQLKRIFYEHERRPKRTKPRANDERSHLLARQPKTTALEHFRSHGDFAVDFLQGAISAQQLSFDKHTKTICAPISVLLAPLDSSQYILCRDSVKFRT
ncbi:hypothetical protein HPB48_026915 [Haemaphysalis longicornis]|uniref:Uncharacterized protein n=1 Tax=Haemaphysalis longicornis TaxID=44386 RepID=A0A9J6HDI7_HAELO|nr:hypothetical protein HPB48_026915 [Haemaphysalis longicornis]